ncbi:serine/threonine-protein phosphatase 4 regulatory subunit 4-like isoform X2 [Rhodnius prolixus]|uniref:serine/threonine-protein phosphatase 4 regulatory subunit 4-like isoform X2 n=1 Tax=Rhodnius prolixus TaxID=13249 RepID=UPI003D18F7E3
MIYIINQKIFILWHLTFTPDAFNVIKPTFDTDPYLFGEEVQKLSVIQALPDLLSVDKTGCLQKILPKMQQALINGSTEVHVTASLAVRAIIADNVLPVEMFIRHFLHTITQAMDSRDPAVAVSWSDTLLEAIKILPDNVIQGEIVPLAVSRAQLVKPVPIRVSSCKLLGELAVKYDAQTFKRDLMPTVISLCQDVSGDVRAEMAKQLVKIAPKLGPDLIKSNITQPLIELSSDDIPLVKENTFVTVVETLPYFTTDSLKSTVLPLLKQMIVLAFKMDDSLLVTISNFFGKMCLGVEKFITESEKDLYIKWYATLAVIGVNQSKKDARVTERRGEETHHDVESSPTHRYTLCRKNCAHTFPAMAKFTHDVAKKTTFEFLHNTLKLLVSDPCYVVRKSIACVFNEVCLIYWKYCNFLKDDFITLCKDDSVDVLDGILPNLYSIMEIFTHNDIFKPDSHDEVLSNLMRTLVKTEMTLNKGHRWRSYLLFIEQTRNFYRFVPSDMLYNTLILSCLKITTISRVVPVRLAAMKNLLLYLRYSTRPQQRKEMKDKIVSDFCLSKNFYDRIIYVRIIPTIMEIFSTFYFKEHFFLSTIHLFSDPVPNIRCALVALLPKFKGMLRLPADNKLNSMLEATFPNLEEDKDRETKRIFLSVKDSLEETDIAKLFPDDLKKHEEEKRLFTEKKDDLSQKGGKSPRPQQKKKPISAQTTPQTQPIEQRNVPGTVTPPGTTLRPPGRPPPARPRNVNRLREREMSGQEKEFYVDAGVHLPGGVQQLSIISPTSINSNNNSSLKRWDNSSHRIPVRRPNTQRHSLEFTDFNKNITITDKSTTSSLGATTIRNNNHRSHLPRPLSCINFQTTGTSNKSDSTIPTTVSANSPSKQRHISKLPVINRSSSESQKVQRKSN